MTSEILLAGFILACLIATVIVYAFNALDLSRFVRTGDAREGGEGFFEYPDHALLILICGLIGLLVLAILGWRIPQEVERLYGAGGTFRWLVPDVAMTTLGRAAQVIGAVCFFLVGLRWMRPAVFFGLLVSVFVLGLMAFGYVFP